MTWTKANSIFQRLKGVLVLLAVECFLLMLFPPSLVLNNSFITGGDTPSHFPAAAAILDSIVSGEPLVRWTHGNYAGFPVFLNYFPLPFFITSLLSIFTDLQIAFKLVTLLPVLALPPVIYASLSRLGYARMVPALGCAFALLFLLMPENTMWGGSIASTLAGEFSHGLSLVLALFLCAKVYGDIQAGRSLVTNSFLEGLVGLSSGYPLLQFGFGSSYFLLRRRFIPYLIAMHALAFGLIGFWILPLLWRLPWDTPFTHAWSFHSWKEMFPPALFPPAMGILLGWASGWLPGAKEYSRSGEPDQVSSFTPGVSNGTGSPEQYLWWNIGIALIFFSLGNAIGVVDIRFLPFAYLFLILLGAIGWGKVLERLPFGQSVSWVAVVGIFVWSWTNLQPARNWSEWNYSGFEAKSLWKPFSDVNSYLRGNENSPRVVYEHSEINNDAGTPRAFELLPYFSGRSTLEGLYMQSSLSSPFVFYLQSELSHNPSCPFSGYYYSRFDPERAARHLRLFNVSQVISATGQTASALDLSSEFIPEIAFPPYRIHRVSGNTSSYVEPVKFAPRRIPWTNWKKAQFDWFRKSDLEVPLVVASGADKGEYWRKLAAYEGSPASIAREPLPGASEVKAGALLEENAITVETSSPGHPLWLKVSYHPDWRIADGKGELYLASPAFMLLVPGTEKIVLRFDTSGGVYAAGKILTLAALCLAALLIVYTRGGRKFGVASHGILPGLGSEPFPSIPPAIWAALILVIAASLWHRDERDPILLYEKGLTVYSRASKTDDGMGEAAKAYRTMIEGSSTSARAAEVLGAYPNHPAHDSSSSSAHIRENATGSEASAGSTGLSVRGSSSFDTTDASNGSKVWDAVITVFTPGLKASDGGPLSSARAIFRRCIERYPLSPVTDHAAHYVAATYMREQRWEDVERFYELHIASYPDSRIYPEALYGLGLAAAHLRGPSEAVGRYRQCLEYFPESDYAYHSAARLLDYSQPEQVLEAAEEYFRSENFTGASPLLKALSDLPPSPTQTRAALLLGYAEFYRSHWTEAAKLLTEWINMHKSHPGAPDAFYRLGQAYMFMGYYREAKQCLDGALALNPNLAGTQPFEAVFRLVEDFSSE